MACASSTPVLRHFILAIFEFCYDIPQLGTTTKLSCVLCVCPPECGMHRRQGVRPSPAKNGVYFACGKVYLHVDRQRAGSASLTVEASGAYDFQYFDPWHRTCCRIQSHSISSCLRRTNRVGCNARIWACAIRFIPDLPAGCFLASMGLSILRGTMMSNIFGVAIISGLLLLGVINAAETIYYTRRAVHARPEWKDRIWILAILQIAVWPAFILLWIPGLVPQREMWNVPLCGFLVVSGAGAIAYRILMRRILGTPFGPRPRRRVTRPTQDNADPRNH